MSDTKIAQYRKLTDDIRKLEGAIDQIKKSKSNLAKALLDENGKEHVYKIDDADYFVSSSKAGTFFLTPSKKGPRKAKAEKPSKEPKPEKPKVPGKKRGRKSNAQKAAEAAALATAEQQGLPGAGAIPDAVLDAAPTVVEAAAVLTPVEAAPEAPVQDKQEAEAVDALTAALGEAGLTAAPEKAPEACVPEAAPEKAPEAPVEAAPVVTPAPVQEAAPEPEKAPEAPIEAAPVAGIQAVAASPAPDAPVDPLEAALKEIEGIPS